MVVLLSRRVQLVLLGCLALSFAVGRCSPIAPSIPKSSLHAGERQGLPPGDGTPDPSIPTSITVEHHLVSESIPPELGMPISSALMEELKTRGRINIPLLIDKSMRPAALLHAPLLEQLDPAAISSLSFSLNTTPEGSPVLQVSDPRNVLFGVDSGVLIPDLSNSIFGVGPPAPVQSADPKSRAPSG